MNVRPQAAPHAQGRSDLPGAGAERMRSGHLARVTPRNRRRGHRASSRSRRNRDRPGRGPEVPTAAVPRPPPGWGIRTRPSLRGRSAIGHACRPLEEARFAEVDARPIRGLDHAHDVEPELRRRGGRRTGPDCATEVVDLNRNRLAALDVRRHDVARPILEVLAERLGIARHHAGVVYAHRLGAAVVVHDHLLRPHHGRPAQLAGCEPGQFDVSDSAGVEFAGDERHVLVCVDAGAARADDLAGAFVEPIPRGSRNRGDRDPRSRSHPTGADRD